MPQLSETVLAPELDGGQWIQHGPVSLKALRDKAVVLVDFWDYTCVNCIRTLPYVVAWNKRYKQSGLVVVGVHAPEFSFAREGSHVAEAAARFGLEYPIVLDNEYAIWRAYSNRFWPAKYLVDAKGRIRYYHFGEGAYQETEVAIQGLIRELNPRASLPPPMEPVRDSDRPGAVCYRVTPELYLGHARGQFGNFEGVVRDRPHDYRDAGPHVEGMSYLAGRWRVEDESARSEAAGAAISLRYTAKDVNLVMGPRIRRKRARGGYAGRRAARGRRREVRRRSRIYHGGPSADVQRRRERVSRVGFGDYSSGSGRAVDVRIHFHFVRSWLRTTDYGKGERQS